MTDTPGMLRAMGGMVTALGVKPEIEFANITALFDHAEAVTST